MSKRDPRAPYRTPATPVCVVCVPSGSPPLGRCEPVQSERPERAAPLDSASQRSPQVRTSEERPVPLQLPGLAPRGRYSFEEATPEGPVAIGGVDNRRA